MNWKILIILVLVIPLIQPVGAYETGPELKGAENLIRDIDPQNGTKGVMPSRRILITFNQSMNSSSDIYIKQLEGTPVNYTVEEWRTDRVVNDTLIIDHTAWDTWEDVKLEIGGYETVNGTEGNYTFSFTVLPRNERPWYDKESNWYGIAFVLFLVGFVIFVKLTEV